MKLQTFFFLFSFLSLQAQTSLEPSKGYGLKPEAFTFWKQVKESNPRKDFHQSFPDKLDLSPYFPLRVHRVARKVVRPGQ